VFWTLEPQGRIARSWEGLKGREGWHRCEILSRRHEWECLVFESEELRFMSKLRVYGGEKDCENLICLFSGEEGLDMEASWQEQSRGRKERRGEGHGREGRAIERGKQRPNSRQERLSETVRASKRGSKRRPKDRIKRERQLADQILRPSSD
jgi:hypothetical protein